MSDMGDGEGAGAPPPSAVQRQLNTPTCPRCGRDLMLTTEGRTASGKWSVALMCSVHGTFPSGWRNKFLDRTRAEIWAHKQRQLRQR
jgi:hypothetical protein